MNQEQKKHLRERLRDAERAKDCRFENIHESAKPQPVKAAEKRAKRDNAISQSWRNAVEKDRKRRYDAMMKAASKVKEVILFGEPAEALVALQAFEGRTFT